MDVYMDTYIMQCIQSEEKEKTIIINNEPASNVAENPGSSVESSEVKTISISGPLLIIGARTESHPDRIYLTKIKLLQNYIMWIYAQDFEKNLYNKYFYFGLR